MATRGATRRPPLLLLLGLLARARAEEAAAEATLDSPPVCAEGSHAACGGAARGKCVSTNEVDACDCGGTRTERFVGRFCERTLGVGRACPEGCEAHGECVHGWCECEPGWSGVACELPSWGETPSSPFLTQQAVRAALDDDSTCAAPPEGAAGGDGLPPCCRPHPDYRVQIYRRLGGKTEHARLLASLPPELPPRPAPPDQPRHGSCAIVGSSSVLLEKEAGAEIDAHDVVFRINRAPTKGFEKHVGAKTTYDWLNSGPHTRSKGAEAILPRLDTILLHGTTTPLLENGGYKRYLEWVPGHVEYAGFHPHKAHSHTRLVSLDFLHGSWEAFHAYTARHIPGHQKAARPSSGWHVARLALGLCANVSLYGFSLHSASDKFHYYDSLVQSTITPGMKDAAAGGTHRFQLEHDIFAQWAASEGALRGRLVVRT